MDTLELLEKLQALVTNFFHNLGLPWLLGIAITIGIGIFFKFLRKWFNKLAAKISEQISKKTEEEVKKEEQDASQTWKDAAKGIDQVIEQDASQSPDAPKAKRPNIPTTIDDN